MALCEIQWAIKLHFSTEKVNHIDKVVDIAVTPSASFGQLNLAINAFQYTVWDV